MNLDFLKDYMVLVVFGICLCVGYIIKKSLDFIPNKYIPLIMGVLGLVINVIINWGNVNADVILGGMFSGLASTGFYEMFKQLINDKSEVK